MRRPCIVASVAMALLLPACAHEPPPQAQAHWTLTAASNLNADALGRPAPLVVRVYVLAARDAFDRATFFELYDHDRAVLGNSALERSVIVLKPGEHIRFALPLDSRARALGVLAAYQCIDTAQWRTIVGVDPSKPPTPIDVAARFDASGVTLALAPSAGNKKRSALWRFVRPLWEALGG
jgi:type VI secretion system protein VasD